MRNVNKARWWGTALVTAMLLGACGDEVRSPLAPTGPARLVGSGGVTTFTVTKDGGTFRLAGGHQIVFKKDAICDPVTSGYGPETWDLPCQPARTPIVITATSWTDENGHPRVDFLPNLRFTSLRDGGSKVLLQLKDPNASDPTAAVFYCPTAGECYDESRTDAGVVSKRDARAGWVYRYIKHFSGYNVTAGRASTAEAEVSSLDSSY